MSEQASGTETTGPATEVVEPIDGVLTPEKITALIDENASLKTEVAKLKKELANERRIRKALANAGRDFDRAFSQEEGLREELTDATKVRKEKLKKLRKLTADVASGQQVLPGTEDDDEPQTDSAVASQTSETVPTGRDDVVDWAVNVLEKSQIREKLNEDHPGITQTVVDKLVDNSVGTIGLLESRMKANPDWWWKDIKGLGKGGKDKVIDALQALRQKFPAPQQLDELIPDYEAEAAGRKAQSEGVERSACPYTTDGMQGRSWLIGWDGAATGTATLAEQAQERAHAEGWDACRNGVPLVNCPHADGSMLANYWQSGWQGAADKAAKTVAGAEAAVAETTPQPTEQAA